MCPANHINSRSLLRSSSTREPSDPPHRVVFVLNVHFSSEKAIIYTNNINNAINKMVIKSNAKRALSIYDK